MTIRKGLLTCLLLIPVLITANTKPKAAPEVDEINAPPYTAAEVIAAINAYRKENGVRPMKVDSTLMTLAQTHADYQASIGSITHTGPGGTRPIDRAYAAGYGGGNKLFFSEIIYGGTGATVETAMAWWKNSAIHNRVMLDPQYYQIGAGVSTDGSINYFTAEIGNITGVSAPAGAGTPATTVPSSGSIEETEEYVIAAVPVVKATPNADGAVIHIVDSGQSLWTIAAVYEVEMQELIELNELTQNPLLHPGDKIIIHPAGSTIPGGNHESPAGQEQSPSPPGAVIGEAVSIGGQPTRSEGIKTPLPTVIRATEVSESIPPAGLSPTVRWIVILAFASLFFVMAGSIFLQTKTERPEPTDDPVR